MNFYFLGGSFLHLEYFKRKETNKDNENCHCFTVLMTTLYFFLDLTQASPSPGGLFRLSIRIEMSFFCAPGAPCTNCRPSLPTAHCPEAICLHICARRRMVRTRIMSYIHLVSSAFGSWPELGKCSLNNTEF